ncbi:MAG: hypothetical protein CW338_06920 [Clostridiales bacterium]|nr:hypothetical protein [Clostridiales bacterium]
MKHCILAKFADRAVLTDSFLDELKQLFSSCDEIPGVRGARLIRNCIDRDNRYDLLIMIDLDREALPAWDASPVHAAWKTRYGSLLQSKAIFDTEEL